MTAIRRLFGFTDDATAGGSEYDDLVSGAIPDATVFWPVTGGTFERGLERNDHNDEVRGRRAAVAPTPFRAAPVMTIPVPAYLSVAKKAFRKCLGGDDTVTDTAGAAPYTHRLAALGYGSTQLPAVHLQMVRDDMNHKVSGAVFNQVAASFPMDGEGTLECTLPGLYYRNDTASPPTVSFTGLSDEPLYLRDARVVIDGAARAIPDLQGFDFTFMNNVAAKHYALRNVVSQSIGTPAKLRKVWFPAEMKLGASQDVTYAINLGNTNTAQELAYDFGQVQQFVFECMGAPIARTVSTEILRITIEAGEHTGGGAEGLSARDDITSRFEGGAFYNETAGRDILIEVLDGVGTRET